METCAATDVEVEESEATQFQCYAIQVLSNCEAKVKKSLLARAKVSAVDGWIGRVLFPVEMLCEVRNGKKVVKQRKLYPGYLFVEMDLYDDNGDMRQQLWQFIMGIDGISGFVGSGKRPAPLKSEDVDRIRAQAEIRKSPDVVKAAYAAGDFVKITDGPFSGSSGEVESVDESVGTLRVSVGLFGRKTPVDLEFWQVCKEEV
ncbi:MAG: transcription termination/antitermination protein NusG [Puniceicoccales bacterium]|jgi:transcriptional antiterminator NusG|nr:transcription termination/antitermination protein NusG [Puniceicoccales bacterium]